MTIQRGISQPFDVTPDNVINKYNWINSLEKKGIDVRDMKSVCRNYIERVCHPKIPQFSKLTKSDQIAIKNILKDRDPYSGFNSKIKSKELSRYNKDDYDFTFEVGDEKIFAHQYKLAIASPYFARLFSLLCKESSLQTAKIEELSPEIFKKVLRYIYNPKTLTFTNIQEAIELFLAADYFQLPTLTYASESYFVENLKEEISPQIQKRVLAFVVDPSSLKFKDYEDAVQVFLAADFLDLERLKETCQTYMVAETEQVKLQGR